MNLNFITSLIVAAECMLVLFIVVISEKLSVSFQTEDFKYIKRAWWVNLIYVLLELINFYFKTIDAEYQNLVLIECITFIDVFQFTLLFYTLAHTKYQFPLKQYVTWFGNYWYIIGFFIFLIALIWDIGQYDYVPFLNAHLIPNIVFNITALWLSAIFFKSMFINYRVNFKSIFYGTILYAGIQIVTIIQFPKKIEPLILLIGWIIGLISKGMICWGLLLIFKNEASRSRRLEKILGNIFHELKNTLYGIDAPVKRILYLKNTKPKDEAQEIGRTYETMASIIDATWLMFKNELDNVKDDAELQVNLHNLITKNKEEVRLNSLVEIAVKLAKNIPNSNVKFHNDYGGECKIMCFRHEVIQILFNLVKNSTEAFLQKQGNIYITTRNKYYVSEKGDDKQKEIKCVNIEIVDDGPGIPPKIQNKIFDLGFTTKIDQNGTGRGLSVVKELVENNNGRIQFESPIKDHAEILTGGTKFTIFFEK